MSTPGGVVEVVFDNEHPRPTEDVSLEFDHDPGFRRYNGPMGQGGSCINTARARAIGARRESDYRVRAWWRTTIVNDPKVFAKFYKARLEELSLDHFNERQAAAARKAGEPAPTPLKMDDIKLAADIMKAIIEDRSLDSAAKIDALYKQIYENPDINPQIKAMVTISLNNEHGREKRGINAWMNQRKGTNWFFEGSMPDPTHPSKEKFEDVTGMYRFFEVYDTLNAIQAMSNISLKETDANNFAIVSKGTDGVERPLIHSHIEEIPNTEGLKTTYRSHYSIDKDVQPADMDQAICLLGEAIASHRQVCDVASANVARIGGMKSPLQVMRLAEELICRYHMHLDLSDVKAKVDAALDTYEEPDKTLLKDRWNLIQQAAKLYSVEDNSKLFIVSPNAVTAAAGITLGTGKYDHGVVKDNADTHDRLDAWLSNEILGKDIYANLAAPRARAGSGFAI